MILQKKQWFKLSRQIYCVLICSCVAGSFFNGAHSDESNSIDSLDPALIKRRLEVLSAGKQGVAALPFLQNALKDDNAMIRQAAVRSLNEIGAPAWIILQTALKDQEMLVRRTALYDLFQLDQTKSLPFLANALDDSSELIRIETLEKLIDIDPRTPNITDLLNKAEKDTSSQIRDMATKALWPFNKIGVPLQDKPEYSAQQLTTAQNIPLPEDNWRFHTDPNQTGQAFKWFRADYLGDIFWATISVNNNWERQIKEGIDYDGIAWYRQTFLLPEKPAQVGVNIVFSGVGESAWVWINGEFIGAHDIWPKGKEQPFSMDVEKSLKWGQQNQITVRVRNRSGDGGIWAPVYLDVIKSSKGGVIWSLKNGQRIL